MLIAGSGLMCAYYNGLKENYRRKKRGFYASNVFLMSQEQLTDVGNHFQGCLTTYYVLARLLAEMDT